MTTKETLRVANSLHLGFLPKKIWVSKCKEKIFKQRGSVQIEGRNLGDHHLGCSTQPWRKWLGIFTCSTLQWRSPMCTENNEAAIGLAITSTPPKTNMSPETGPSQKEFSSSKHQFVLGDMLNFKGSHNHEVHPQKLTWIPKMMVLEEVTPFNHGSSWYLC